jgi:hypothetical protein
MHSTPIVSLYAFAVLFIGLGLPGIALWALFRVFFGRATQADADTLNAGLCVNREWFPVPAARSESAMPAPVPRDEREYFQAAHYAMEHELPSPPLPPRDEREEW